MEKNLQEFLERRENKLTERKNNDKKRSKDFDSGMSKSDLIENSCICQLKTENKIYDFLKNKLFENREKSLIIARALDGLCPNCHKEQISVELIQLLNLPICEKCKKIFIQKKIELIITEFLDSVMLKEKDKINSYLTSLH